MSEEVWEKVWNKTLITSDYSLKYLAFMERFEKTLPDHAVVVEAGCGTGQTLTIFSERHTTIALDISPHALALARKSADPELALGTIFSIPFKDESCDLVYNSGVIEHFRDPHNANAVQEMARVVKKGGFVIVIVPNTFCPWYKIGKWIAVILKKFEFGYEEDYSLSRLRSVITAANLTVISEFGLQALPPLATNAHELLPMSLRKRIGRIETILPFKQFYGYAVGIIAQKK
jgi:ubiquinone/menaquinone biosynthesis C-methylase UbiE